MSEINRVNARLAEKERRNVLRRLLLNNLKQVSSSLYQLKNNTQISKFILSEILAVETEISSLEKEIRNNPNQVFNRDINQIQTQVLEIKHLGMELYNKEIVRLEELKKREEEKNEILRYIDSELYIISDPIESDFAEEKFRELKKEAEIKLLSQNINLSQFREYSESTINQIKESAKKNASEWKNKRIKSQDIQVKVNNEQLDTIANSLKEVREEDPKLANLKEKIINMRNKNNLSFEEQSREIENLQKEQLDSTLDEEILKETVLSIKKTLENSEFRIKEISKKMIDGKLVVVIHSDKPSGKYARCTVDLSGNFIYKFDNYEGLSCKKDIAKFEEHLEEIYGIKLSQKTLLHQNPERLSSQKRNIQDNNHKTI